MTTTDYWVGVWLVMGLVVLSPHIKEVSFALKFSSICVLAATTAILINIFS